MCNPALPKYTFLFVATYDSPEAIPVIVRTQADTEDDARANLAGGFTLEFVAKIRTDRTVFDSWWDKHNCMLWTLQGTSAACAKDIAGLHHA
jgi:hypothetical protein